MTIKFNKISEKAVQPARTENSGAGFNLVVDKITTEINERGQVLVVYHSGIAIEYPEDYEVTVRPATSICAKTLRMCDAPSVVPSNINEEVVARFITTTDVVPAVYNEGDVFAQLVINKKEDVDFEQIELVDTEEDSASSGSQSLPETEGEPTNSETPTDDSGEAQSGLEQAE